MSKQKPTLTETNALTNRQIKKTPFFIHERDGKRYITCGHVAWELDEEINIGDLSAKLKQIPWEYVGMFCQAILTDLMKDEIENLKK